MIRVELPFHLERLAGVEGDVALQVEGTATLGSVLDALEAQHPVLRGTIRDQATRRRRPFLRFFACRRDLSDAGADEPLPPEVGAGREPLLVVGAIAGG